MPRPLPLNRWKPKPAREATLPRLGLASLQVRMGWAYMWTNILFLLTLIFVATVAMLWINRSAIWPWPWLLGSVVFLLAFFFFLYAPLGAFFGLFTARRLTQRLLRLAQATTTIANGQYTLRVPVQRKDEVGILETQFNAMAQRLAESWQREQALIAQNVLLAERARIARELHDAIAQNLFSLSLLASGMQAALPAESPLQSRITLFEKTTEMMTREMRALLLELRPAQLEELGLKEALEEIATAYSSRLDLGITTEIASVSLPATFEHAILRITQEALANAIRHARATHVSITLTAFQDRIELTIVDDGHGFDPQVSTDRHGLGLRSMRERVQELNGIISLESQPENGTHIQFSFPREESYPS